MSNTCSVATTTKRLAKRGLEVSVFCAFGVLNACSSGAPDLDPSESTVETTAAPLLMVNQNPTSLTYLGTSGGAAAACNTPRQLLTFEPTNAAPGERFPVFIFTIGLNGSHAAPDGVTIAREAARRGYVAATMQYAADALGCDQVDDRANCSYNSSLPSSAVSVLCSRPLADCSQGVVTFGHSLGGSMAVRAKNFNSQVRATVTIGTANGNGSAACMNPGPADNGTTDRALRNNEWRLYAGETEFAENNAASRNVVTGQSCAGGTGSIDCLRPDGSGWYQVANAQIADNVADHCYQLTGNGTLFFFPFVQSCGALAVDPGFVSGTAPWSLGPAIDFLSSRVGSCVVAGDCPDACTPVTSTIQQHLASGRAVEVTGFFVFEARALGSGDLLGTRSVFGGGGYGTAPTTLRTSDGGASFELGDCP